MSKEACEIWAIDNLDQGCYDEYAIFVDCIEKQYFKGFDDNGDCEIDAMLAPSKCYWILDMNFDGNFNAHGYSNPDEKGFCPYPKVENLSVYPPLEE